MNTDSSPSEMRCLSLIYKSAAVIFLTLAIFMLIPSQEAFCMSDIRVGLVSGYVEKPIITVYNKRISLGYAKKTSFKKSFDLYSESGFSFEAEDGSFYVSGKTFKSLEDARKGAGMYTTVFYPCLVGKDTWRVYIPSDQKISASLREDIKLSDSAKKSKYLMSVTYDKGLILIDSSKELEDNGYSSYPQIKGISSKSEGSSSSRISLGTRSYRGRMEIGRYAGKKVSAVNIVSIEAYLAGVVTCEMSTSYDLEALKAQAVCARSYAYVKGGFTCVGTLSTPYKLTDTTSSQVYKGYSGESEKSRAAVKATAGEIIYSEGKPVEAFYFSTSGGATESAVEVWGTKSSIYTSVFDEYELSPEKKPWVITYSYSEVEKKLKDAGYNIGTLESISEEIVTSSGRVFSLKVVGSKGKASIDLNKAESMFSLPSSKYRVAMQGTKRDTVFAVSDSATSAIDMDDICLIYDNGKKMSVTADTEQLIAITDGNFYNIPYKLPQGRNVSFFGMGYGHGIGLSQAGAQGLAQRGYSYKKIIDFYYKNVYLGDYDD